MPNHCETDLTIIGKKDVIESIIEKHFNEEGSLICETLIPYPKEYAELDKIADKWQKDFTESEDKELFLKENAQPKDGFNSGGYEWCIDNWGTKWGTYNGMNNLKIFLNFLLLLVLLGTLLYL